MQQKSSAKVYPDRSVETLKNRRKTALILVSLLMLSVPIAHYLLTEGKAMPTISNDLGLQPVDSAMQNWSELRGMPLIVSFWATTCTICMHELDDWKQFYQQNQGGERFELLAIAMHYDRPDDVMEVRRSHQPPYPLYFDLQQDISRAFGGVIATPTVFLVDRDGRVIRRFRGRVNFEQLRQELKQLG